MSTQNKQNRLSSKKEKHLKERKQKKTEKHSSLSVKLHVYILLQFLAIILVFMYMAFTITMYPHNYLWVIVFLMIIIIGFLRGFLYVLVTSLFVIFGYGSFIMYKIYFAEVIAVIQVNDLFWMIAFPGGAVVSGLLGNEFTRFTQKFQYYEKAFSSLVTIDVETGFSNERQLRLDLWKELSRSLRYKHSMTLLLMEVAYFNEMKKDYGEDKTVDLLKQIVEQIESVLRDEDKKSYLGDGLFGIILPETNVERVEQVIARINESINTVKLNSVSGKRQIQIKLKYGFAGCPEDHQTVSELFEKAKQTLGAYVV